MERSTNLSFDNYKKKTVMDAMENLRNLHKEKYGVEPNVIGLLWNDIDKQIDLLIEAVEGDKPYDEYRMLTKEEQKYFDKGEIVF